MADEVGAGETSPLGKGLINHFDAPARDNCEVRRTRSNTPLQALVMLNDRQVLEASRVLAARLLSDPALTAPEARIEAAFRRILTRKAGKQELKALLAYYQGERERYRGKPEAAARLLQVGLYPIDVGSDPVEQAALMLTVSVVYNLDESLVL